MQVGCGVYVHPVRERRYLYFWHYESRGGSRVQVKEYMGPLTRPALEEKPRTGAKRTMQRSRATSRNFGPRALRRSGPSEPRDRTSYGQMTITSVARARSGPFSRRAWRRSD